jgi:multiple sugar transport system ATP-binding protein
MTLGDRIAVMRAGVLQQVAPPETLYRNPANSFVAGFIGSPPINLVPARLKEDGTLEIDEHHTPLPAPLGEKLRTFRGRKLLIGIRPEDLVRGTNSDARFRVRGTVEVSEPLGNETLVYWRTSSGSVVSRLIGSSPPEVGAEAMLEAPFEALHVFDPESERALI